MSLALTQNFTACVPGADFIQFVAVGGTAPYTYAVLAGGAGGSINSSTGSYTAPLSMTAYQATKMLDTISVTDTTSAVVTSTILVATPFFLVLDILQNQLGLDNDHIYSFNQKVFQPTDSGMYLIASIESCKPFGNNIYPLASNGSMVTQYLSMSARLGIDIISRGPAARDNIGLIPLALNSIYSQQQQDAMGFYLGKLPLSVNNVSGIDGAAIPFRFHFSWALQYLVQLNQQVPFFDTFPTEPVYTNP